MAKLLNIPENKETACQDSCQEPDISHVFERNSPPWPGPGHRDYQAVTVSGVSPGPGYRAADPR